jgi:hydroxymethylglutaryl-CoA lyase
MDAAVIVEVGPRDGLQNEPGFVATADKLALIARLAACGLSRIEATAFVAPKWVPQMADHDAVMRGVPRRAGLVYSALVPNAQGAAAAIAAGADELAIFTAASESFCRRNINCTIAESLERFRPVMALAAEHGLPVRGYVSCVTDCPYEGAVAPAAVTRVALALRDLGCAEIALGETLGRAEPGRVAALVADVVASVPPERLAGHFHDTGGQALASIDVCLAHGIRVFDAAAAGLGGCPYAPGAKGNVATGRVARHLAARGFRTGIDAERLAEAEAFAAALRSAG